MYKRQTLQREANRYYGFTAQQTLDLVQTLYEKKLLTYPRTDSQFITDDMEDTACQVISIVCRQLPLFSGVSVTPDIARVTDNSKVTDHHAILPTVQLEKQDVSVLPQSEQKILNLVGMRLLCATGEKHTYAETQISLSCEGYAFKTKGKTVVQNGWKAVEELFKSSLKTKEKDDPMKSLPEVHEGDVLDGVSASVTEHFTTPPKQYTEDSLLSAMERAGAEDMGDDVERKGLGTPATRADIIEKLVKDGFVKREKKQMIPTEDGMKLITVLPDVVKSPKLTADWENALTLVSKGEYTMQEFMDGIENMVCDLVRTYHSISEEQKSMFGVGTQEALGKCPKCGGEVVKGKFGAYCKNKCGMNVGRAMGAVLSDSQIKSMLEGKKTLVKGLKGKKGSYDAYLIPEGIEDYSYMKDGKEIKGSQYKLSLIHIFDPFMGSGTTGLVASQMGRHFVGIELNPEYTELCLLYTSRCV